MSIEVYANNVRTTLSAPMLSGDDHAHVAAAAPAALQGRSYRVLCEAEIMLVTSGASTTTWTVTRGIEGTSAVAHATGAPVIHVLTAAGILGTSGDLDVRQFGAKGDDSTDDTTALQAAFAALGPVENGMSGLYFPPGVYRISDTLDIPLVQYRRIYGATWGATIIKMTANNKPIIRATYENTHSITIEHLTLAFSSNQSSSNTSAYGIQFAVTGGTGQGFYRWTLRCLAIEGAAVGFGIAGTGSVPVWGSTLDSILFSAISIHAIDWSSPTTIGMPSVEMRGIQIFNYGTPMGSADAVVLDGVEAAIDGLGIEDWSARALYVVSGSSVFIRNLHVERHTFTTGNNTLVYIANGPVVCDGVTIAGSTSGNGITSGFQVASSGSLDIRATNADWTLNGGVLEWLGGDPTTSYIWSKGCTWKASGSATNEYLASGYGTGLYVRVTSNDLPPTVDTLPTGAAVYRGRRFRVLGGAGVADVVSECSKNAADAYVWVTK